LDASTRIAGGGQSLLLLMLEAIPMAVRLDRHLPWTYENDDDVAVAFSVLCAGAAIYVW
jgi:hypothetical protein